MVDGVGKKLLNSAGRGSIGKGIMGRKDTTERERQKNAKFKAMLWRDKARYKFMQARKKLKAMLMRNEEKTKRKLNARRINKNPLFFPLTRKFERRGGCGLTHSTMPKKPRYSIIEPRERIYGKKWNNLPESQKNKMHPAMKKAMEQFKADIMKKAEEFRIARLKFRGRK